MRKNVDLIVGMGLLSVVAVGCGGQISTGGDAGADLSVPLDDGGVAPDLRGTGCVTNAECSGGVCVGGACCPSLSRVCGTACCGAGQACLFDKCVTPGKPCHTANECGPGEYWETGLAAGPPDGGGAADLGAGCTQPVPLEGRCLPRPPVCGSDGGMGGSDGGCVPPCEYHPPVGKLNAVVEWSWGPQAKAFPNFTDVWATPTVGRLYDGNCDGKVDILDAPSVVFVSGRGIDVTNGEGTCCQCTNTTPTSCHTGILRALDGRTGQEIWSLDKAEQGSAGFAGLSVALGDIDNDGRLDIVAATGEGKLALIGGDGKVKRVSNMPVPGAASASFGWGGGIAIADMDGDGFAELAYGSTVFSTANNAITLKFTGTAGTGGGANVQLPAFADVDGMPGLELVAGNTAYRANGSILWNASTGGVVDGFPAIGDFNKDGKPEVVVVGNAKLWILTGATGVPVFPVATLPSSGNGGPPTVADFDGDGRPEIGVAQNNFYSVWKPDYAGSVVKQLWRTPNHDLSSSQTGSTVFDFEGDGAAEVIYNDECYLWVFDGKTGAVRFAGFTTSFTATEASLVADVDGDGRAEIVMVSNGADPVRWGCVDGNGTPTVVNGVTWKKPTVGKGYRGITVFGDKSNGWVGTRTLWNQHGYHVSNICDDRDSACAAPNVYGSIPKVEKPSWTVPWLNNFRQNVQDRGVFDAPDATVSLSADCTTPVVLHPTVRNAGLATLPAGVEVGLYVRTGMGDKLVATVKTTQSLQPGQSQVLSATVPQGMATFNDVFIAKIVVDPQNPTFRQCRDDNDASPLAKAVCVG